MLRSSKVEPSIALLTPKRFIISPASGIHRPSYNGAPARQTWPASIEPKLWLARCLRSVTGNNLFKLPGNVCWRVCRIAHRALD